MCDDVLVVCRFLCLLLSDVSVVLVECRRMLRDDVLVLVDPCDVLAVSRLMLRE